MMKNSGSPFLVASLLAVVVAFSGLALGQSRSIGTTYLPLDHWAYPAIERAIAKGAIPPQFLGQRPWTRTAIAELLQERRDNPQKFAQDDESLLMVRSLEQEFEPEMKQLDGGEVKSAQVEDVYTRVTGISGTPLRDSYHFGQTIVNDFGRPYGEGMNNVTGATARATYGVFGFEGQGEYQHGAGNTPYNSTQLASLASIDHVASPILPNNAQQDNGQVLDSYAGVTWKRSVLTFGRESNWWGPGESSAMLMSDNVAPFYMLKWDVDQPVILPWILKYLGPVRFQAFYGKTKGHFYPRQPYLHGEKISMMWTKNLEIGLSRTVVWAGFGHGITMRSLLRTYFIVGDQTGPYNPETDPGDRRGGLDVTYKVPGIRNLMTVYFDAFTDDDPLPASAPNRAAYHPGFYLTHIPGIPKLDFRAEGAYTELPTEPNYHGYFFYTNSAYRDGYTQEGLLIGDWVGREGKGGQLSSTYWLAPDKTVQVYWRDHMVASEFIPGGARQNDFGTTINYAIGAHWRAGGTVQYETYKIPFLAPGRQSNTTVGVSLSYWPHQERKSK